MPLKPKILGDLDLENNIICIFYFVILHIFLKKFTEFILDLLKWIQFLKLTWNHTHIKRKHKRLIIQRTKTMAIKWNQFLWKRETWQLGIVFAACKLSDMALTQPSCSFFLASPHISKFYPYTHLITRSKTQPLSIIYLPSLEYVARRLHLPLPPVHPLPLYTNKPSSRLFTPSKHE